MNREVIAAAAVIVVIGDYNNFSGNFSQVKSKLLKFGFKVVSNCGSTVVVKHPNDQGLNVITVFTFIDDKQEAYIYQFKTP